MIDPRDLDEVLERAMRVDPQLKSKAVSSLVEDMIRLAPLFPKSPHRDETLDEWAARLADAARAVYDQASARIEVELAGLDREGGES